MHRYTATTSWQRGDATFTDSRYSRRHSWRFDGGVTLAASSWPQHVAEPMSDASAVDPEEAFVAALSSCHLLTFLWVASKGGRAFGVAVAVTFPALAESVERGAECESPS